MKACDDTRAQLAFYLDDELCREERDALEAHLSHCFLCRNAVEEERRVVDLVRAARPLYDTPASLRRVIEEITSAAPAPYVAPSGLYRKIRRSLSGRPSGGGRLASSRAVLAAAAVAMICLLGVGWYSLRGRKAGNSGNPSRFAAMAVDNHIRQVAGRLPMEITSQSPDAISNWFGGRVDFQLQLPNYPDSSTQDHQYRLKGGRLVGFKNDYAAFVSYEMDQRPVSLIVTSDSSAQPSGGQEIVSQGISFHYDTIASWKVVTWSDRGLTYALVSSLDEPGQQSCMVCHQSPRDRELIEGFNQQVTARKAEGMAR